MAEPLAEAYLLQLVNIEFQHGGFQRWQDFYRNSRDRLELDVCKQLINLVSSSVNSFEDETWLYFHQSELAALQQKREVSESLLKHVLQRTGQGKLRANALFKLADLERVNGKYDNSLIHYEEAAKEFGLMPEDVTIYTVYHMMGVAYWAKNDYQRSEYYYRLSQAGYKSKLDLITEQELALESNIIRTRTSLEIHLANVLRDLGDLQRKQGKHQIAEAYLRDSMQILTKNNSKYELQMTLIYLGKLYREQKKWKKSIKAYSEALTIARSFGASNYEVEAMSRLAEVFFILRDYAKAREWADKALHLSMTYEFVQFEARTSLILGLSLQYLGEAELSKSYIERALSRAKSFSEELYSSINASLEKFAENRDKGNF